MNQDQFINADIETVWSYFSSPRNLNQITPPDLNFKIIEMGNSDKMFKGQTIRYTVSPFPFLRVGWVTEIIDVIPKKSFVDFQKKGPFKIWHHEHIFFPAKGGVEMCDRVSYALPLGFLGRIANWLFVQRRVNYIFEYRRKQIETIFSEKK